MISTLFLLFLPLLIPVSSLSTLSSLFLLFLPLLMSVSLPFPRHSRSYSSLSAIQGWNGASVAGETVFVWCIIALADRTGLLSAGQQVCQGLVWDLDRSASVCFAPPVSNRPVHQCNVHCAPLHQCPPSGLKHLIGVRACVLCTTSVQHQALNT